MLALSPETVLRWHRSGKLPGGRRLGCSVLRFDAGEIEAWLEGTRAQHKSRREHTVSGERVYAAGPCCGASPSPRSGRRMGCRPGRLPRTGPSSTLVACGFGPHTFRAMRQNARGLRASGRIAVLGGLRAERRRAERRRAARRAVASAPSRCPRERVRRSPSYSAARHTRLLFPAPSGAPYDACNFRRREFKWAVEAAGPRARRRTRFATAGSRGRSRRASPRRTWRGSRGRA
jgi:predicted DNA-binding transcriptional regulator AlpA